MSIRIILADDHPVVLSGLSQLFALEEDIEVVAQCSDGQEALEAVRRHVPDVLVLDVRMPRKDGLTALRELSAEKLPTRVVLLTAGLDEDEVLHAIRSGVGGVVLKDMAPRLLVQCVRKVAAGGQWLEKASVGKALEKLLRREAGASEIANLLTPREMEVMKLATQGMRNKEIAERLCITEGTVKIHLHATYEKLKVNGRVELTLYAQERGLN